MLHHQDKTYAPESLPHELRKSGMDIHPYVHIGSSSGALSSLSSSFRNIPCPSYPQLIRLLESISGCAVAFFSSRGIALGLSLSNAVNDLSLTVYQVKLQHILGASKDGKTRFSAHKLCSFHGTYFLSGE